MIRRAISHVPRLVPAGERTTGQGGYLTTPPGEGGSQLRAQCRMFAGFPLRSRHYGRRPWSLAAECSEAPRLVKQSGLS